jgi:UPF0271 protein
MHRTIDLNADVGEGFGPYDLGNDEAVLEVVSSVNIACGFHAGDPATMRRTVKMARDKHVAIGAHPGLPDRLGFGRRKWDLDPQDAYDMVVYQVGALWGFARAEGAALRHVKPHGALYNMAAECPELASAIAQAVKRVDASLILVGLAGSHLIHAGSAAGLRVGQEAFTDRMYEQDGSLTPRSNPEAVITDTVQALCQLEDIVKIGTVRTRQGGSIPLQADTLCLHGDRADIGSFARAVRKKLDDMGIRTAALHSGELS